MWICLGNVVVLAISKFNVKVKIHFTTLKTVISLLPSENYAELLPKEVVGHDW